jgi:hypothetical protein
MLMLANLTRRAKFHLTCPLQGLAKNVMCGDLAGG